jgi:hypothetical protein
MNSSPTRTAGTLTYRGRSLRISPYGTAWQVTEAATVSAEFDTGGEQIAAVESLGVYASKAEAIAAAKKIIV